MAAPCGLLLVQIVKRRGSGGYRWECVEVNGTGGREAAVQFRR